MDRVELFACAERMATRAANADACAIAANANGDVKEATRLAMWRDKYLRMSDEYLDRAANALS